MSAPDSLSRRQVLTGRVVPPTPPEAHISSLVVHVRPENLAAARAAVMSMTGVEVHAESSGKMVVTVETATEAGIVDRMNEISGLEGVMSAALVFHHFEPADAQGRAAHQE